MAEEKTLGDLMWETLNHQLKTFLKSEHKLFVLVGDAGIGKTFFLRSALKDAVFFSGASTPAALNDFLANNQPKTIVLDDTEGWETDRKAISILKAACSPPHIVKWESKGKQTVKEWLNVSKIVIVLNQKPSSRMWKALLSRAFYSEVFLTDEQRASWIKTVGKKIGVPTEVSSFVSGIKNSDLRLLEKAQAYYTFNKAYWQELVLSEVCGSEQTAYIAAMDILHIPTNQQQQIFSRKFGTTKRTYFYHKQKLSTRGNSAMPKTPKTIITPITEATHSSKEK